MSDFKAKMHQNRFRHTPLGSGELTALPQIPQLDLTGPTSKGNERKGEGKEKGATRKGGEGLRHGFWGDGRPCHYVGN